MSEFNKDAPVFTPKTASAAAPGKLNLVSKTANDNSAAVATSSPDKKEKDSVEDVTASVAKVKIRHDLEGERKNYRESIDHLRSGKSFEDFKIPPFCLKALTFDLRFSEATQIQAETIPITLDGRNILAQAQAGSGKSIAFAIGIINQVDTSSNRVQAICIAPTRHLASQLRDDAIVPLAKYMDPPCRVELAVRPEGDERGPPKGARCPAQVVVGTAGTVIKWIRDRYIDPSGVKIFVVDEADEMIKESTSSASTQVLQIKKKLPRIIQTLFFSATYPPAILDLANSLVGENAVTIKVKKVSDLIIDKIFQVKIECRSRSKIDILEDVYSYFDIQQSMVFCETKKQCDLVRDKLTEDGFTCSVIHSKIANADEEFERFRRDETKVLISTDILSRGIDVPTVAIVINFDVPRVYDELSKRFTDFANFETYTHRIARSSRMGYPGTAITLLKTPCDSKVVSEIEQYYDTTLRVWDEDDIESLAKMHKMHQSGVDMETAIKETDTKAKVDESDWT